jgi:hypothetical protein
MLKPRPLLFHYAAAQADNFHPQLVSSTNHTLLVGTI